MINYILELGKTKFPTSLSLKWSIKTPLVNLRSYKLDQVVNFVHKKINKIKVHYMTIKPV